MLVVVIIIASGKGEEGPGLKGWWNPSRYGLAIVPRW